MITTTPPSEAAKRGDIMASHSIGIDVMSQSEQILAARFSDSQEVLRLATGAVRTALLDHKRTGGPIAVWRDGKVVLLPSEQIELQDLTLPRKS